MLLILSRTVSLREGLRYRIVDSISLCPSHCWTVRRSTPAHKHRVANVERNLCSQKSSLFNSARSAHAFRQSRKSSFGLHPLVGNTRPHVLSALAFHVFSFFASFAGIGISRSFSVYRGQSFLPTRPRIPFAFKKVITVSNLLYTDRGDCSFSSRRNPAN